jgi:hypothetical protein
MWGCGDARVDVDTLYTAVSASWILTAVVLCDVAILQSAISASCSRSGKVSRIEREDWLLLHQMLQERKRRAMPHTDQSSTNTF